MQYNGSKVLSLYKVVKKIKSYSSSSGNKPVLSKPAANIPVRRTQRKSELENQEFSVAFEEC